MLLYIMLLYIQAQFVKEEKVKLVGKNDRLV